MTIIMYNRGNTNERKNEMTIRFINENTGEIKEVTLPSNDYFAQCWIDWVAENAPAWDGWRYAENSELLDD